MSISLYRCDGTDRTLEIGSARQSNALDVVTNNHTPGAGINTSVELADQVLDYYVDVWFDANGEVISPLLISAVAARPDTLINAEWVELYNASSSTLPLSEFALGDEETPGASEAMVNFPSDALLLAPGQFVTVARSASAYQSGTGRTADYEIEGTDTTVRDMEPDPSWGSASFVLTDSGDQILLLDGQRTLVDAVTYGSGALPGVEPLDAPSSGRVEYRAPVGRDRNAAADFSPQTGDLSLIVNNHQTVLFNGDVATYIIEVFNRGPNAVANASITIDLLLGLDLEASDCVADTPGSHCIAIEAATRQGKFDLPMNGALHFAIKARVESGATNTALLQATLTPPPAFAERFPLDNKASDSDPITPNLLFADGFEPP